MSEIQRSTSPGPLSAADADARLRHAPQWFREKVSAARELRGLAPLPVRRSARVAPPRRRPPAAGAAPAAIMPRSTPTAVKLPKVAFVLAHGTGEPGDGKVDIEIFTDGAFDGWLSRVQREGRGASFEIRAGGHGTEAIASAADGSFEFRNVGAVGPVVIWQPDAANARHRVVVEMVRAGQDAASVEFHALRAEFIDGVRVVREAAPCGVALLRRDQAPAYRGSLAAILPGVEPIERELIRVAGRSLKRSWGAA